MTRIMARLNQYHQLSVTFFSLASAASPEASSGVRPWRFPVQQHREAVDKDQRHQHNHAGNDDGIKQADPRKAKSGTKGRENGKTNKGGGRADPAFHKDDHQNDHQDKTDCCQNKRYPFCFYILRKGHKRSL